MLCTIMYSSGHITANSLTVSSWMHFAYWLLINSMNIDVEGIVIFLNKFIAKKSRCTTRTMCESRESLKTVVNSCCFSYYIILINVWW